MTRLLALLAILALTLPGCGRSNDKGINKDQDRPVASGTKMG